MKMIKSITAVSLCLAVMPALAYQTMTCISENNAFTRCNLSHADQRNVQINNATNGDCNVNGAWGVDSTGVWVDKNCGAVFQYQALSSNYSNNNNGTVVVEPYYQQQPYYEPYYYGGYFPNVYFYGDDGYYNHHHHNYYHNGGYYHGGGYHH